MGAQEPCNRNVCLYIIIQSHNGRLKNMASIKRRVGKNGNVTYQVIIELGRDPITGKRQRIFRTVKGTKKQAQALMDKLKVELERGYVYDPSSMKLEDWITQWLDYYLPNIEATTRTRYRNMIKTHIIAIIINIDKAHHVFVCCI